MSYQLPSLRNKDRELGIVTSGQRFKAPTIQPLAAPDAIASDRLAICRGCALYRPAMRLATEATCLAFGCCQKDLSQTVKLALQQCPAGRWPRWIPQTKS